jgi:hypothetical protein
MSKVEQAIKALTHAQDIDSFYPGGDRLGVRQCIDKAVELLRDCSGEPEQPAIPEGFTAYDGSGQPVADDVVVKTILRDCRVPYDTGERAETLVWEHNQGPLDIIAYRIIHDPARLPDVPWEDYPEARWATINMVGVKAKVVLWREGELVYVERLRRWWPAEGAGSTHITTLPAGEVDMTHLDPARCKWERPPQRSPRKSIDDAKPEEWDRAAKIDREGRISYSGKRKPTIDERLAALEAEVFGG